MSEGELLIQTNLGEGLRIEDEWSDMRELMAKEDAYLKRSC